MLYPKESSFKVLVFLLRADETESNCFNLYEFRNSMTFLCMYLKVRPFSMQAVLHPCISKLQLFIGTTFHCSSSSTCR